MEVKGPVSCAIEWCIAPTFGCAPSPTFLPERWNETTGAFPIVINFENARAVLPAVRFWEDSTTAFAQS